MLKSLLQPAMPAFPKRELWRAPIGAALGLAVTMICVWASGALGYHAFALIAPLGATSLLVFTVPNGPLSQPVSCLVGNTVSAFIALALALVVPHEVLPPIAVAGAIAAMLALRSLHPPGGAVALFLTIDPSTHDLWYALVPVASSTLVIVLVGILWNRATGRHYPFRQPSAAPSTNLSTKDLEVILQRMNQNANLGTADLARLIAAAETEVWRLRFQERTCDQIMQSPVFGLEPSHDLATMLRRFNFSGNKSLPVIEDGRTLGVVTYAAVMRSVEMELHTRKRLSITAPDLMEEATKVAPSTAVGELLAHFAKTQTQFVVVEEDGQTKGVISRSDVIRLMLETSFAPNP